MQWQFILLCIICAVISTISITVKRFKKIDNLWIDRAIFISQGLIISIPLISTVVTKDEIEQRILMALGVLSAFSIPISAYVMNAFNALFARKNYVYLDPSTSAEHKYGLIIGVVVGLILLQLNQKPDIVNPVKQPMRNPVQVFKDSWMLCFLCTIGLYISYKLFLYTIF